jgi:hypothetical protein
VPAMTVEINGEKFTSAPLKLKVLASDPTAPPAYMATNIAFTWLTLPKTEVYVGEILVAEIRLYVRNEIPKVANLQVPNIGADGFITGRSMNGGQFQRRIGTTSFSVIPVMVVLTPVKTGTFNLGNASGNVVVLYGQQDFFGNYRQRAAIPLSVQAQTVQVLPLPTENVPAGFSGAVGSYTLSLTAGPTNVATGDPITVRVTIAGRGALDALTLPEQAAWQNFKTYPPNATVETSDPLGLQGTKKFEQVVSPQSADIKELPPLSFAYFDPAAKAYRTLTHAPVPLAVRSGGQTTIPTVAAGNREADNALPQQDIVAPKQRLGNVSKARPPLLQRPWFVALQTLPVLLWLAALGWRKNLESLANNPRLRRQRQVAKIIHRGLNELRQHAAANQSDEFFATLFRLLQEQLGERLDCPASAITEAVIDERLRSRNVDETTLTTLHELFQACNQARYAPIKSSQELAAFIPTLEGTLNELQAIDA